MGVQLDLIVPPIIVGVLIILIFRLNAFMMESTTDARLVNDVQTQADVAIDIIQEELRGLDTGAIIMSQDTLQFSRFVDGPLANSQDVMIVRDNSNRQLKIHFQDLLTGDPDSTVYALNLFSIEFSAPAGHILRARVVAESRTEQHVRFRNDDQTVRAVSERDFFLRQRAFPNTPPPQNP